MAVSEKPAVLPDACASMAEVRREIDRVDRILVKLLAERQRYIEAAARLKDQESDIRVEWRIEDVLGKVRAMAEREGLALSVAEPVWRELIERCIEHERESWALRHSVKSARSVR